MSETQDTDLYLFSHITQHQKNKHQGLRLAFLAASFLTDWMPMECLFVPVCIISANSELLCQGNLLRKALSCLHCPLLYPNNMHTHPAHNQTCIRHVVGVAGVKQVTLSLNGSRDIQQLWCIREKKPQLACSKCSIHKQGGWVSRRLKRRHGLNENEIRLHEGELLSWYCVIVII